MHFLFCLKSFILDSTTRRQCINILFTIENKCIVYQATSMITTKNLTAFRTESTGIATNVCKSGGATSTSDSRRSQI